MQKPKRLLSIGEASEYLSVSIDTLRRWEKRGKIESLRSPGNHRYFSVEDLDKLFGKKYQHDKPKAGSRQKQKIEEKVDTESREAEKNITQEKVREAVYPFAPIVYPTLQRREDTEIIDRPAREVRIPEVKLIRIIQTKEEERIADDQVREIKKEETSASILTPANLEKPTDQAGEEDKTISQKPTEPGKRMDVIRKNFIIYAIVTLSILIAIAAIFFFIGVTSQDMLSPIP